MEVLKLTYRDGAYYVNRPGERQGDYVLAQTAIARISQLEAQLEFAEQALAAAREENERLQKAWSEAEKEWKPHCLPDENCPTYYDGCHCSPATAAHFAEENERLESELAATREDWEGAVHETGRLRDAIVEVCGIKVDVVVPDDDVLIAALKSRSDDAGRVERAAAVMIKYKMKIPAKFKGLTWEVLARAVLAAADREGE